MSSRAGERTDSDVKAAIKRLIRAGYSPREIEERLDADERYQGRVPTERTIRDIKNRMMSLDPTDNWQFPGNMTPEDARLVMDVIGWLRTQHFPVPSPGGEPVSVPLIHSVTEMEAHEIALIRRAYPEMSLSHAYFFAVQFIEAGEDQRSRQLLNDWLISRVWEDDVPTETQLLDALVFSSPIGPGSKANAAKQSIADWRLHMDRRDRLSSEFRGDQAKDDQ